MPQGEKPLNDHDTLIEIHTLVKKMEKHLDKLNGRVYRLEKWRWQIGGGLIVVSALAGWGILG